MILSGAILVSVSVLGGILGTALTLGRLDENSLSRDVVINGAATPAVPGKLNFEVSKALSADSSESDDLPVGIAVDYATLPIPTCTLADNEGNDIALSRPGAEEQLLRDSGGDLTIVGSAVLPPGSYEARCAQDGDSTGDATFTVGRVFGFTDIRGVLAPVLWFLAVGLIAGVMFLVGAILAIIGLVRRSRTRKLAASAPFGPGGGSPGVGGQFDQHGPGPNGAGMPQGTPDEQQPQEPAPSLTPPPWPGPHPPGPPEAQPRPNGPPTGPPTGPPPADPQSGWTIPPSKR